MAIPGRTAAGMAAVCVALAACRTGGAHDAVCRDTVATASSDPKATAAAFADALEAGKLEQAYALVDSSGESLAAFQQRYSEKDARRRRAAEIRAGIAAMRVDAPAVTLASREGGWKVIDAQGDAAHEALAAFLAAAEGGDFAKAYALLSGSWRAQYTPERLRQDFEADPLAKERLARARAALSTRAQYQGDAALFAVGDGKAVRLVREGGSFRVAALE